uniref:Uncharacterized protein n=1 Tax=Octopus bimaculoides TaxID=37653 RepID=A0A0L8HZZ0_OCTBM
MSFVLLAIKYSIHDFIRTHTHPHISMWSRPRCHITRRGTTLILLQIFFCLKRRLKKPTNSCKWN